MIPELPQRKTLQSWKEIASYLGITARSAQRWEKEAGLPVYRHAGSNKSHVFAYTEELQKWLESGGLVRQKEENQSASPRNKTWLYAIALSILALGSLTIFLWRTGTFPFRRIPYSWVVDGAQLKILDNAERLCWQRRIPPFHLDLYSYIQDRALITDIDSDGCTEVLINIVPENFLETGGSLLCYEQNGDVRWEYHHGSAKTFGARTFDARYIGRSIRLVRIGGKSYILTIANHHLWYPAQVALLDPKTGRLLEEYWHPGWIYFCQLRDIDNDGVEEVLLATINNPGNGLGHAGLAVLKLPFSRAPRRKIPPDYPFQPVTGGGELAYFLFPQPDINEVTGLLPKIYGFWVNEDGQLQVVLPTPEKGAVIYTLDMAFRVLDCRTSDNFAAVHGQLQRQGLLNHPLTGKELDTLKPAAPDGNSPALMRFWSF
jgi:hypothetical protein